MKILALGTGDIMSLKESSCYMVDNEILIDIPNGTCKNLRRNNINPNQIRHILITHFHGDHYFDIPFYLLANRKVLKENKKCLLYTSKDGISKIKKVLKLAFPNTAKKMKKDLRENVKFITTKNFEINDYVIEKIEVNHGNIKPSYGYIFSDKKVKIGFTGDTNYCDNVDYMATVCNYLFCDCSLIIGNNKHIGIDNIELLAQKYKNCKFIVTHLADNVRKKFEELKIDNVIIPNDGDVFDFS